MKLAFCLFNYYPYGGLERRFFKIASICQQRGHEVHVFTMQWRGPNPNQFKIHLVNSSGYTNHQRCLAFSNNLQQELKKLHFDCVIGFNRMAGLDLYYSADICYQQLVRNKHGRWYQHTPRYKAFTELEKSVFETNKFESGQQTKIFYLNEQVKVTYQQYYQIPDERFCLLPGGIAKAEKVFTEDIKKLRRQLLILDDEIMLLMVGSDFNRKGVARAIKALAALLPKHRKRCYLFIAGRGNNFLYELLARFKGVSKQIKFLGARNDIQALMQAADFLIHPAKEETSGMVILESIAAGLPALVTENCGYAFHIKSAQSGIVAKEPFVQDDFNNDLFELVTSHYLYDQWRQQALEYAAKMDLYHLAERAVDFIETFEHPNPSPASGRGEQTNEPSI